ncbi:MAG TPA: hypothetical protein PKE46_13195 [Micropruina sp.]|nr:hypothetical protein [Micropruina sp.]HMR23086.1 hypothetical protein [Micropruina sp.]
MRDLEHEADCHHRRPRTLGIDHRPGTRRTVYLTRRNRPVVAVIDSAQLKKLLEPTTSQTSAPSTPLWEETERLGETPIPWEEVQILPVAARAIRRLPPEAKRRIEAAIELLADDPPAGKLTARPEWRILTGNIAFVAASKTASSP